MFNKSHMKYVFKKINIFYNRLEYISKRVQTQYPIIDEADTQERYLLLEKLTTLMKKFEEDILAYKDKKFSFSELEYKLEKYKENYALLELNFPILECFKPINPPVFTGDVQFPLSDIAHYGFSSILNTNKSI